MAIEIERKFLVIGKAWRAVARPGVAMVQAYLGGTRASTRVRIAGAKAWLNLKSQTLGNSRLEFEYEIPVADAQQIVEHLSEGPVVAKTRHEVPVGEHCFEVDVFAGDNAGLIVAEIELGHPDEDFLRPDWLGAEVTDDARYYNAALARHPYCRW